MGTNELRLIAIGCGRVFERYHLPAIRAIPGVRLLGLCETDPGRLARISDLLEGAMPRAQCTQSIGELLQSVEVDAALVCTPPSTHVSIAEHVLRAGLHVLVEKPMAVTVDQAKRLWATEREAGRVLRVGFNRRYRAGYSAVRVQAQAQVRAFTYTFVADARRWNPQAVPTPEFVLHDAGSHAVDLAAHLAGRRIERVRAVVERKDRGMIVRIQVELAGGASASCVVGQAAHYREQLSVTASGRTWQAEASSNLWNQMKLACCKLSGRPTPTDQSFRAQVAGFAAACRGENDNIGADAAAGLAAVAAITECIASVNNRGEWRDVPQT